MQLFRELTFVLLLFIISHVYGQTDTLSISKPSFSMGFKSHYGFIIPHSQSIRSISYSNPFCFEAEVAWHYSDIKSQSYCNCFPRLGISLLYINFDNPNVLGYGLGVAPYVEPFFSLSGKWKLSFRFSSGVVYLNNVFDRVKNPDNLFYSTHNSFILTFNIALNYMLSRHWNFRVGGNYNHISNGGNKQPNKGINFPTVSLGFDYILKPVNYSIKEKFERYKILSVNTLMFIILGTGKAAHQKTNNRKLLYGFSLVYGRTLGRLSIFTAGVEYVNDGALKESLTTNYPSPPDHKRVAVLAGHEVLIGKFRFSQQLGVYVYSPAKAKDPLYQRWGLDYYMSPKLYVGTNIKAHRHVADFLDFRIGYIIN